MPMLSVFIGSILNSIRILRLNLLNPRRESGITTSTVGGTSESATWILLCTRTTGVRVCNERGFARRSLLAGSQVNLTVTSDLSRGVGILPRTVVAIHLYERTCSRLSRLISATAALGRLTPILTEKITMTVVGTERVLVIAGTTPVKIEIAIPVGIESGFISRARPRLSWKWCAIQRLSDAVTPGRE